MTPRWGVVACRSDGTTVLPRPGPRGGTSWTAAAERFWRRQQVVQVARFGFSAPSRGRLRPSPHGPSGDSNHRSSRTRPLTVGGGEVSGRPAAPGSAAPYLVCLERGQHATPSAARGVSLPAGSVHFSIAALPRRAWPDGGSALGPPRYAIYGYPATSLPKCDNYLSTTAPDAGVRKERRHEPCAQDAGRSSRDAVAGGDGGSGPRGDAGRPEVGVRNPLVLLTRGLRQRVLVGVVRLNDGATSPVAAAARR